MKNFARFLSVMLSIALLLTAMPVALASTSAQREKLASYLELMMPYEKLLDSGDTLYDDVFDIGAFNYDDYEAVVVYVSGSGVDAAVKKIKTGASDADEKEAVALLILMNFVGKIAKNTKAYGASDVDVYFMYTTNAEYAGGEYSFVVRINVAKDEMYFLSDDIFNIGGTSAISSYFDPTTYELNF